MIDGWWGSDLYHFCDVWESESIVLVPPLRETQLGPAHLHMLRLYFLVCASVVGAGRVDKHMGDVPMSHMPSGLPRDMPETLNEGIYTLNDTRIPNVS